MTLDEFVKDLTREMEENEGWRDKEIEFCTIDGGGLEYLSIYDLDDTVCIDVGTGKDSDRHTKAMLG